MRPPVAPHADTFVRLGGRMTKPECYDDARRIWPNVHPNARRAMVKRILATGNPQPRAEHDA